MFNFLIEDKYIKKYLHDNMVNIKAKKTVSVHDKSTIAQQNYCITQPQVAQPQVAQQQDAQQQIFFTCFIDKDGTKIMNDKLMNSLTNDNLKFLDDLHKNLFSYMIKTNIYKDVRYYEQTISNQSSKLRQVQKLFRELMNSQDFNELFAIDEELTKLHLYINDKKKSISYSSSHPLFKKYLKYKNKYTQLKKIN